MQLPILSSLTTLFSTVTDEFKNLFQAWSLVAAGIYLFLNVTLLFPLWRNVSAFAAVEDLTSLLQAVAASLILFGLAYLINALGGFFVSLANGRIFRGSGLGAVLERWQKHRFDQQKNILRDHPADSTDRDRAAYRLAYEFPAAENLSLTRLGNIQASVADYSVHQYGAHLDTVWPIVEAALAKDESGLIKKVGDEQTSMTFLATVAVLLGFTAITAVPLRVWLVDSQWPWSLPIFIALLIGTYVVYRAAALRAAAWGRLVRLALDLHLKGAETALGLRELKGEERFKARRDRWVEVSRWLAYGGLSSALPVPIPQPDADWFEKKSADAPITLTCSAQLKADIHDAEQVGGAPSLTSGELIIPGPAIEYVIPITHMAAADEPEPLQFRAPVGGFVRVVDSRVPSIEPPAPGKIHRPNGKIEPVYAVVNKVKDGSDALLWPIARLDYRDSATLIYKLGIELRLKAGGPASLVAVAPTRSGRPGRLALELAVTGPGEIKLTAGQVLKERIEGKANWRIADKTRDIDHTGGGPVEGKSPAVYDEARREATWKIVVGKKDDDMADKKGVDSNGSGGDSGNSEKVIDTLVVSLPLTDHGLSGRLEPISTETQQQIYNDSLPTFSVFNLFETSTTILEILPDIDPFPTSVTVVDEESGQTVNLVTPQPDKMQHSDLGIRFKVIATDKQDAAKAAGALDRYDLLSHAETTSLNAADLNNLACFLIWQASPDVKLAYELLKKADEQADGDKPLKEAITKNLKAIGAG